MHNRGNYKQGEKTALTMGEIIANETTDKELISKIYKQLNSRKIYDPIKKMGQSRNVCSPKKTYRWLTNTGKDAQHYSLSEKCKPKPQ